MPGPLHSLRSRVGHDARADTARPFLRIGRNGSAHQRKEMTMSTQTKSERPLFRVTFASVKTDKDGNESVGKPREIGAAWSRRNGKKGAIVALDLVPVDFAKGVIFLLPVDQEG
jgi:hypothetical protein